jgi:dTDP-4-dehydrorhamnose 3,5-epimerase
VGKLEIKETNILGVYLIKPIPFVDSRGKFLRVFCQDELKEIFNKNFVQINHSITYQKGSIRGMHFQYPPNSEVKVVKCIRGSILDVVVDIREDSPTFLQHFSTVLSEENYNMLYIPEGFAHGFQTLEDNVELLYFHSEFYTSGNEGNLNPLDGRLNINWLERVTELSDRDKNAKLLTDDFKGIKI